MCSDKMNVIKGRNETGKSVMFKVFRQMCFSNFLGKNGRRTLISRGKERGDAIITLTDGTRIIFEMYPTYQIYRMNGNSWKQDTLPKEIKDKLGWYVDEDNQILLNLIDTEMSMPLVSSSASFNANVLKFIVEDEDLERSIRNYTGWINKVEELEEIEEATIGTYQAKNSVLKYTDIEELKKRLDKGRKIERNLEIVENLDRMLDTLSRLKEPKGLGEEDKELERRIDLTVRNVKIMERLEKVLQYVGRLEKPTFNLIEEDKVEKCLEVVDLTEKIITACSMLHNNISSLEREKSKEIQTNNKIKELEEELGVCYTCGKPFKEDKCNE